MEKIGSNLLFENAQIRVWNLILEPGEVAPTHQHEHPYVFVALTDGNTLMIESDGTETRQTDRQWDVVEHPTGLPHSLQNVGSERYSNVIIELKSCQSPDELLGGWVQAVSPAAAEDVRAGLSDNPGRISRGYGELLSGYGIDPVALLKVTREVDPSEPRPGWVTVDAIDFVAMCPHHFMPYFGSATVSYRPKERIIGLGKIPRFVDALARRLVIQEDLARDIATGLGLGADTADVKVSTVASHLCICRRGVRGAQVTTTVEFEL